MKSFIRTAGVAALGAVFAVSAQAATLQIDFDISFGDPNDPDTAAPGGISPWLTAVIDDGGSAGSATLTLQTSNIGSADITQVYLNFDDVLDSDNLSISFDSGPVGGATVSTGIDGFKADADGLYDILIDFSNNDFMENETVTFNILGSGAASGFVAGDFNYFSTPADINGPFLAAAKVQSTGNGEQSDWIAAVPVPGAVWLFGSAIGFLGWMKRRSVIS